MPQSLFTPIRSLGAALALAALPFVTLAPAQAASAAPAVIDGRAGLLQACPQAAEQLQEVLRHHVLRRGEQGRMAVRFTLQDGRVSAVETRDGPARYQPYVRLAVAGLQCSGGTQQHSFEIDFRRA